jgi:hypothetical protein
MFQKSPVREIVALASDDRCPGVLILTLKITLQGQYPNSRASGCHLDIPSVYKEDRKYMSL